MNQHNCENYSELLPDYLQGTLGRTEEERVEAHLSECSACQASVAVWNKLGMLPMEQPSAALRDRFNAMLLAYQESRSEEAPVIERRRPVPAAENKVVPIWSAPGWQRWAAVAAAVVLLVGGFAAGRLTSGEGRIGSGSQGEVAAIRSELSEMRQLVVLSMLQQQSASERLQAISLSSQQGQSDPRVLEALLGALRYDGNVDVRLAALDALSRHGKTPMVQQGLVQALQPHQSPLVSVALIDTLVEMKDPSARAQLQKVRQDPNLNPVVRQRADWALSKLN